MTGNEVPPAPRVSAERAQYSVGVAPGHRHEAAAVPSSKRLRLFYFGAASLWGFFAGVAGLLAGLSASGSPATTDSTSLAALVPALGIAIVGAGVLSGSYHEARRRRR